MRLEVRFAACPPDQVEAFRAALRLLMSFEQQALREPDTAEVEKPQVPCTQNSTNILI